MSSNCEPADNTILLTKEAAKILGLTPQGVRWLTSKGLLACDRAQGGASARVYNLQDVLRLKQHRDEQQADKEEN